MQKFEMRVDYGAAIRCMMGSNSSALSTNRALTGVTEIGWLSVGHSGFATFGMSVILATLICSVILFSLSS